VPPGPRRDASSAARSPCRSGSPRPGSPAPRSRPRRRRRPGSGARTGPRQCLRPSANNPWGRLRGTRRPAAARRRASGRPRRAAGATPQIAATAEVAAVRRARAVPAFALVLAAGPVILVGAAAEDAGGEVIVALPALAVAGVAIGTPWREVAVDAVRLAGTA